MSSAVQPATGRIQRTYAGMREFWTGTSWLVRAMLVVSAYAASIQLLPFVMPGRIAMFFLTPAMWGTFYVFFRAVPRRSFRDLWSTPLLVFGPWSQPAFEPKVPTVPATLKIATGIVWAYAMALFILLSREGQGAQVDAGGVMQPRGPDEAILAIEVRMLSAWLAAICAFGAWVTHVNYWRSKVAVDLTNQRKALQESAVSVVEVYMPLLRGGRSFWRPVKAVHLGRSVYQIAEQERPADETWQFAPGDMVVCETRPSNAGSILAATRKL